MKSKYLLIGAFLLLFTFGLAACGGSAPGGTSCPELEPCPDCPAAPECPVCEECPVPEESIVAEVPFEEQWASSGHSDETAEAFRHWDEEDPPEVPADCAKCHTSTGFFEFAGADGSEPGVVENNHTPASGIECIACHNEATAVMDTVVFPSGAEITGLGAEARCMQCHQGRASKLSVDDAIEENGLSEDLDSPSEELGLVNIHYYAAAATLYGTATMGGYEYDGNSYDFKNDHVAGYDTCLGCHNPHTLERKYDECAACHPGVASDEEARNIRMQGSEKDYDGDGDIEEGIAFEIEGLREMLYQGIQAYAAEVSGVPIAYESHTYPYFFIDNNEDGEAGEDEAAFANQYSAWTGRLLKAAYNYQTATKDPGAYAHGGKYIIQLLYDSIEDLNTVISSPVDLSKANRIDAGHFAGSEEAFRHWDEDGFVSSDCARCHSATGLPVYIIEGVNISEPLANGLNCATCHDDLATFTRYEVVEVEFPSGAVLAFQDTDPNLCMNCHQGREWGGGVEAAIQRSGAADDEQSEALRFSNPHYFAAGATLFGSEAAGAYQYADQEYFGRNMHVDAFDNCVKCHNTHGLEVKEESCATCHAGIESLEDIRMQAGDFNGNGDGDEGIAHEIEGMQVALLAAMQTYTGAQDLPGIIYDSHSYPYFFTDSNGNGEADPEEVVRDNGYATWTPRLLRAAYNYQWAAKDPGAYAHNPKYAMQFLYDSLNDLGAADGMTRP